MSAGSRLRQQRPELSTSTRLPTLGSTRGPSLHSPAAIRRNRGSIGRPGARAAPRQPICPSTTAPSTEPTNDFSRVRCSPPATRPSRHRSIQPRAAGAPSANFAAWAQGIDFWPVYERTRPRLRRTAPRRATSRRFQPEHRAAGAQDGHASSRRAIADPHLPGRGRREPGSGLTSIDNTATAIDDPEPDAAQPRPSATRSCAPGSTSSPTTRGTRTRGRRSRSRTR